MLPTNGLEIGKPEPMENQPRKYCETLENNPKLKKCCRNVKNLTVRFYDTRRGNTGKPDLLVAMCTCGRRHFRLAAGGK